MRRHRNAKIIATLGSASSSPDIVHGLYDAGADVFRLNFSHGTHEDHKKQLRLAASTEPTSGQDAAAGEQVAIDRRHERIIPSRQHSRRRLSSDIAPKSLP